MGPWGLSRSAAMDVAAPFPSKHTADLACTGQHIVASDAVPTQSSSTELITTVLKDATLIAIPSPSAMDAGKKEGLH